MTFTYEELKKFLERNPEMICAETIYAFDLNMRPYRKLWGCGWVGNASKALVHEYPHKEFVSLWCPNCYEEAFDLGTGLDEKSKYEAEMEAGPENLLNRYPSAIITLGGKGHDVEVIPLFPPAPNIHIHNHSTKLARMVLELREEYTYESIFLWENPRKTLIEMYTKLTKLCEEAELIING